MKSYDSNPPMATAVVISDSNRYDSSSALVNSSGIVQNHHINETGARDFLSTYPYCWPKGLQDTLISQSLVKFPVRFFICDDSGSVILIIIQ